MFESLFGAEMPLAVRFFVAFLIVAGLIGVIAWAVRRFGSARQLSLPTKRHIGDASKVFQGLFWIHQLVLGLPSVGIGLDLLAEGKTAGIINAIGLLLAWIGGTLVWGFAAIMNQRQVYRLLADMNEIVARLATIQVHESALTAVADELQRPTEPEE